MWCKHVHLGIPNLLHLIEHWWFQSPRLRDSTRLLIRHHIQLSCRWIGFIAISRCSHHSICIVDTWVSTSTSYYPGRSEIFLYWIINAWTAYNAASISNSFICFLLSNNVHDPLVRTPLKYAPIITSRGPKRFLDLILSEKTLYCYRNLGWPSTISDPALLLRAIDFKIKLCASRSRLFNIKLLV